MSPNKKQAYPLPKATKAPPYSVQLPGESARGETKPYRNPLAAEKLKTTPHPDIETVYDIIPRASKTYGNAKAVGFRRVVRTHEEIKKVNKVVDGQTTQVDKKWQYQELSGYEYLSYIEYERLTREVAAGLRKLGLSAGDRVHIFAATSPFWLAFAHGALYNNMAIVTAYDTLGEEGLAHSLKQTNAKAIFLDPHLLSKLDKPLKLASQLQHVVYNSLGSVDEKHIEQLKADHPQITVQSFDELRKEGQASPVDRTPSSREDLACIMYTSGSTGAPKGVLLKHKNVIAAIAGVDSIVGDYLSPSDAFLAYLPLAHILEFVFENACFFWGGVMGYGNPRTLSDGAVRNCSGDIREFKPTILVGVPAVWESVKKGITFKVNGGSVIVKNMFWGAMHAKSMLLSSGVPFGSLGTSVLDHVVFSKIREATGGRLRMCLNGGGPIAKETQRFISMAICPMLSGYGLTETGAMGAVCHPEAYTDDALGEIPGSIEIKLVDFPDAGYYSSNNPPQGEIWIRGDSVSDGYLDLASETSEAFTSDGWFKSGDIGEFTKEGYLRIIDRKKNLVKTLNGEYIALEKLESVYRAAPVVANICVYAASDKSKPIAIIVPNEPSLKKLANAQGISGETLEDLCSNPKVNALVVRELQAAGKKGGLSGIEIIDGVVLADEEWTPANGLTTSAQKLNRKGILTEYKKQVEEAYKESS